MCATKALSVPSISQTRKTATSKYRRNLPQLDGALFMTDGGLETTLLFKEGLQLPYFAAFDLLKDEAGTATLRAYYERYAWLAHDHQLGLVLESPTWRASEDWGDKLGYNARRLAEVNRKAIDLMSAIRSSFERPELPMVISGNLGPRGDGYRANARMDTREAMAYHAEQIAAFVDTEVDMVAAFTMNYTEEAIGIALAAQRHNLPVAISFTLETDGRLPSGDSLEQAIARTERETDAYPAYYMINCAHPTHFEHVLGDGDWRHRIHGLRANASRRSHAELDESTDLDDGNPSELGAQYQALRELLPNLNVVGGCCGTDHRHVDAICNSLTTT